MLPKAGLWRRHRGVFQMCSQQLPLRRILFISPLSPTHCRAVQSYSVVGHNCFYNLYQGNYCRERNLHLKSLRRFTALEQPSLLQARDFSFFFFFNYSLLNNCCNQEQKALLEMCEQCLSSPMDHPAARGVLQSIAKTISTHNPSLRTKECFKWCHAFDNTLVK